MASIKVKRRKTQYFHARIETTYKDAIRVVAENEGMSVAALMRNAINRTYPQVPKLWHEYRDKEQQVSK